MSPFFSQTLQHSITVEGRGLHSNSSCMVTIHPSDQPSGLRFRHAASGVEIRALVGRVGDLSLATTLEQDGIRFATVEHLLSALSGLGVDHALIEVGGEELPILDGSAAPWVEAILEAGVCELPGAVRRSVRVLKPVEVRNGEKWIKVEPYPGLRLRYTIDFDHPAIGRQSRELTLSPEKYRRELASARTFCMEQDIEFMRSRGLALGGSLENAVVFGPKGPLNESLRYQDEAVRHKMLDLVGDLALLGAPLQGLVSAHAAGHAMHVALVKALLDDQSSWTWAAVEPLKAARHFPVGLGQAMPA
ncbi:UDP-3-O-acyl-N-acetylglucosamine deacetylase [Holophaga foetida]|uniref:UDP-3-O-acyl-N-acetylglucosamine deacetylase n=1 Tax=Holophaga foetida TaxID=35839 RepID=UPI000247534C|nr:UDP-3-O-acyl-N-acetylglucosamine deacetylase [Holophaga foetida]